MNLPSHEERIATTELELARLMNVRRKTKLASVHVERVKILNKDLRRLKSELEEIRAGKRERQKQRRKDRR